MLKDNYFAEYIGKSMCGFVTNKTYHIHIIHDIYGYFIEDIYSNAAITYASEISIRRYWNLFDENNC